MRFYHLTEDERNHIYECCVKGISVTTIAADLKRSPSTITREIHRNIDSDGHYRPKQAHKKTLYRRQISASNVKKIPPEIWPEVYKKLEEYQSPEQISHSLKLEGIGEISDESIYRHIIKNKKEGGVLYTFLRCQKKRKKRYGSKRHKSKIPNRVGIEDRPRVVEEKSRIGDWEGDTIIGKNHQQAIVSLVDRYSKITLLYKVSRKTAEEVKDAIITCLTPFKKVSHTITFDNGLEFCAHESISKEINVDIYFARPYASWQRGLNENTNGLVRQFFPKNYDFTQISQSDLDYVMRNLNNRPRKTLGYKTPVEVFLRSGYPQEMLRFDWFMSNVKKVFIPICIKPI